VADYQVIADAGAALSRVLWQEIQPVQTVRDLFNDDPQNISLESPRALQDANNTAVRLSLYLYRIVEDPYVKNRPPLPDGGRVQRRAPLTLDLFYLVTPLVGLPREQQLVLGKVMQIFHDRAVLEGSDLSHAMAAAGEELRVVLNPVSLDEAAQVWQAIDMSYRLSVCYVVRVAIVDSTRSRAMQPVTAHTGEFAGVQS
jgi:hypothetical protein